MGWLPFSNSGPMRTSLKSGALTRAPKARLKGCNPYLSQMMNMKQPRSHPEKRQQFCTHRVRPELRKESYVRTPSFTGGEETCQHKCRSKIGRASCRERVEDEEEGGGVT